MKCEIILDLLPLYIDDVVSETTRNAVEEHMSNCKNCKEQYETLKKGFDVIELPDPSNDEAQLFKRVKKRNFKFGIIGLTIGLWIGIACMVYPSINPILKPFFYTSAEYAVVDEGPEVLFDSIINFVENEESATNLRVVHLNAGFNSNGKLKGGTDFGKFSIELCEDKLGIIRVYECYIDLKNQNIKIHSNYVIRMKKEGISSDTWDLIKDDLDITKYDFGASDMIDIHIEGENVFLKGWDYIENEDKNTTSYQGNDYVYFINTKLEK